MPESRPLHVVGAAILRGGRCLVAQRGPGMRLPGKWEFPGGKVEPRERPERALAREIHEELGLEIEVGDWLGRGESQAGPRRIVLDVFAASTSDTTPCLREHARAEWKQASQLGALDWAEADVPILPAVLARLRARPEAQRVQRSPVILCADWSGRPARRAVCSALPGAGWQLARLAPPPGGWSLAGLLDHARALRDRQAAPVLIAIDAVLGLPAAYLRRLGIRGFPAALGWLAEAGALLAEASEPADWRPARPFFRVPAGAGGLGRFIAAAGGRGSVYRQIERRTGARPVFVLSGIPGSVGSGSRALWSELEAVLQAGRPTLRLWPFDGELAALTAEPRLVLGETYPRAAYAVALAGALPAAPLRLAKTRREARQRVLAGLVRAGWVRERGLRLEPLALTAAGESEDDFDALLAAAALVRLVAEGRPLSCELVDPLAEGGILATGASPPPALPRGL